MMANAFEGKKRANHRLLVRAAGTMILASFTVIAWPNIRLFAQAITTEHSSLNSYPAPEWQTAAGGKMEFDVASIRPAEPGSFFPSNINMAIDDTVLPPGGRLSADFPLRVYIEFAYKIMPAPEQEHAMLAHLPKWVSEDKFVIQAKATGNPTKDQMRLMMQSLLADRFKLAAHFEMREAPALALVLLRPRQPGPRLRPHAEGLACDAKWIAPPDRSAPTVPPGGFLPECGYTQAIDGPSHTVVLGSRNTTIEQIADYLASLGSFGRPLVDQTGLSGRFDFSLSWQLEHSSPSNPGSDSQPDPMGPALLEAMKEQLGLKLKPVTAPVQVLVIDHVEQPSPN